MPSGRPCVHAGVAASSKTAPEMLVRLDMAAHRSLVGSHYHATTRTLCKETAEVVSELVDLIAETTAAMSRGGAP